MRSSVIFLIAAFISLFQTTAFSKSPGKEDCREFILEDHPNVSPGEKISLDLVNGIWTKSPDIPNAFSMLTAKTEKTCYQFHDYGMVDVFRTSGNGTQMDKMLWRIETYGDQPFLVLSNKQGQDEKLFQVNQTCEGVSLHNILKNEKENWVFSAGQAKKELAKKELYLSGTWTCAAYPFDLTDDLETCGTFESMKDAYLAYDFQADGTFTRHLGSRKLDIEENGFWELSADGAYLIMHVVKSNNQESLKTTRIAEIDYLNSGELVLKQALETGSDLNTIFCTKNKVFYFNKV